MSFFFMGIDIGGTTTEVVIANRDFALRGQAVCPTNVTNTTGLLAGTMQAATQALADAGLDIAQVTAVGVGIPGQVNPETGQVRHAVNLNIESFALGEALRTHFQCPIYIDNDVFVAAMGAFQFLTNQPTQSLMYLSIGTGISAGLILDGKLYRGAHGMAGEIGHMVMDVNGRACQCGNNGCLEALTAGPAIVTYGLDAQAQGQSTALQALIGEMTPRAVYQAARQGDPMALDIIHHVGQFLGRALHTLVMAYDVDKIIIGGGLARAGEIFLQPILQEWDKQRQRSTLADAMLNPAMLELVPPGYKTGAWGAVAFAAQKFTKNGSITNRVFLALQRYFVRGLLAGSVKG